MSPLEIILSIGLIASSFLIVGASLEFGRRDRRSVAPPRIHHRVTVHTKQPDDQTLFGVLVGDYADRIVLEDAEYVTADGAKPLPGAQHVNTADIAWIDVHALVAPVIIDEVHRHGPSNAKMLGRRPNTPDPYELERR